MTDRIGFVPHPLDRPVCAFPRAAAPPPMPEVMGKPAIDIRPNVTARHLYPADGRCTIDLTVWDMARYGPDKTIETCKRVFENQPNFSGTPCQIIPLPE